MWIYVGYQAKISAGSEFYERRFSCLLCGMCVHPLKLNIHMCQRFLNALGESLKIHDRARLSHRIPANCPANVGKLVLISSTASASAALDQQMRVGVMAKRKTQTMQDGQRLFYRYLTLPDKPVTSAICTLNSRLDAILPLSEVAFQKSLGDFLSRL